MNRLSPLFIATSLLCVTGCLVAYSGIRGSGIRVSESRDLSGFDAVDLSGVGTLKVEMGETHEVTITVDDNLIDFVETEVRDGTLHIRETESIRPQQGLLIEVVLPQLTSVDCSGAGSVELTDITGETLAVSASGACSIKGSGDVNKLTLDISGAGSVQFADLLTQSASVRLSGAASTSVYAAESLNASVSGVGSVNCYGNPTNVNKSISGIGSINLID